MTPGYLDVYLDELESVARAASVAEEQHRKEAARRAEQLKQERAFAWRRLNLLRAIAAAVAGVEDKEQAQSAGRTVFFRETSWNGATQAQREVADRFAPVILAVWQAKGAESGERGEVAEQLAAFEEWYEADRGNAFLHLMEREIVELPLVEV